MSLLDFIRGLVSKKAAPAPIVTPQPTTPVVNVVSPEPVIIVTPVTSKIDWTFVRAPISTHFTVGEALFLPSWNCYHVPTEDEKANILKMVVKMELIREFIKKPITVHCWLRPHVVNCPSSPHDGQDYNAAIGGAKRSAHLSGQAVDWDCGVNCDVTRQILLPKLEEFGICMENLPNSNWVHTDIYDPSMHGGRYFRP